MLFLFLFVFSLLSLLKSLGIEVWMALYIIEYTISLSSGFCCQLSDCHFFEDSLFLKSLIILRFFPFLSFYDLSWYIDLFLFIFLWVYLAYWLFQVSLIYQRSSQYCLLKCCLFSVLSNISFEKSYQTCG